jgi:hypothetical protein
MTFLWKSTAAWFIACAISGIFLRVEGQGINGADFQYVLDNSENGSVGNDIEAEATFVNEEKSMLRHLKPRKPSSVARMPSSKPSSTPSSKPSSMPSSMPSKVNDDCTNAFPITESGVSGSLTINADQRWFKFTLSKVQVVSISTCFSGTQFDTQLQLFSGCTPASFIANNQDVGGGCGLKSEINNVILAVGTHFIQVSFVS